jgi:hypothetical protein
VRQREQLLAVFRDERLQLLAKIRLELHELLDKARELGRALQRAIGTLVHNLHPIQQPDGEFVATAHFKPLF